MLNLNEKKSLRNIDISFVITVFNKSEMLSATVNSILRQTGHLECEYIFVDDASTDNSVEVIKNIFEDSKNFLILTNLQNMGPAIRLNQGCAAASGKYLFLIDADDILLQNALKIMFDAIKNENADFVFGSCKVIDQTQESLMNAVLPLTTGYQASINPLDSVLRGRYVRMAYLITKELYTKSGGADDQIFIQDESLPIRLAYHAKKMITLNNPAVYGAKNKKMLSGNKSQQFHDKFYAYYLALLEFDKLNDYQKTKLYERAVSSVWKAKRASKNHLHKLFFIIYLAIKLLQPKGAAKDLKKYTNFIDNLQNVRKIYPLNNV